MQFSNLMLNMVSSNNFQDKQISSYFNYKKLLQLGWQVLYAVAHIAMCLSMSRLIIRSSKGKSIQVEIWLDVLDKEFDKKLNDRTTKFKEATLSQWRRKELLKMWLEFCVVLFLYLHYICHIQVYRGEAYRWEFDF